MDESKQILIALSRLEENLKNLNSKVDGFSKVSELALQTEQSVKSAHNRLDDLKTEVAKQIAELKIDHSKTEIELKTEIAKHVAEIKTDHEKKAVEQKNDYTEKIQAETSAREKMESSITWLWRTIGTSFIGFLFGLILYAINQWM